VPKPIGGSGKLQGHEGCIFVVEELQVRFVYDRVLVLIQRKYFFEATKVVCLRGDKAACRKPGIITDSTWMNAGPYASFTNFHMPISRSMRFFATLEYRNHAAIDIERLHRAYALYPWAGGYSAVNFYNELERIIPRSGRPTVKAIVYSSPGYIDLALWIAAAVSTRRLVLSFVKSGEDLNRLYSDIYRGMIERTLMRVDVREREMELTARELACIHQATSDLAQLLELPRIPELRSLAPNDLALLKIMLSLYRRVRKIAKYVRKGMINL